MKFLIVPFQKIKYNLTQLQIKIQQLLQFFEKVNERFIFCSEF